MGLRSLAQVLLGMLAFVLFVEMWTALGNGGVDIGGAAVGAPELFGALIGDGIVLVVISLSGRRVADDQRPPEEQSPLYRFGCSRCGWTADAATIEQARALGQQHTYEMHPTQP